MLTGFNPAAPYSDIVSTRLKILASITGGPGGPGTGPGAGPGIGGIGGLGRKHRRVFVEINNKRVWFKNEDNARAYVHAETKRIEKAVESKVDEVLQRAVKARDFPDIDKTPIRVPKIVVKGSGDIATMARESQERIKEEVARLSLLRELEEEEEILLLS